MSSSVDPTKSSQPEGSKPKKDIKKKEKKVKKASSTKEEADPKVDIADPELDSLFKSTLSKAPASAPKAKRTPKPVQPITSESSTDAPATSQPAKRKRQDPSSTAPVNSGSSKKVSEKKVAVVEVDSDEEEEEADIDRVEGAYERKKFKVEDSVSKVESTEIKGIEADLSEKTDLQEEEQEEEEEEDLIHESLREKKPKRDRGRNKTKYVPADETAEQKDSRTIFVGNLPIEVAKNKSYLHQLHQHILSRVPNAKIDSTRFRSAAFAAPTEELPAKDEAEEITRARRQKERTKTWREKEAEEKEGGKKDEEKEADAGKVYQDPKEKKKIAFIKKDFHPEVDHINAYIVFEHPAPDRSANVAPILNPYEAATQAVQTCNGTVFLERTIRVDSIRASASTASTARATSALWVAGSDPKKSVFVGNLELAAKEEDLRAFFEAVMREERGVVTEGIENGTEGGAVLEDERWVGGVRIIRDAATGLGKGFAYVSFRDRHSVDVVLSLDKKHLQFSKRTLRAERCKTLPSKKPTASTSTASTTPTIGNSTAVSKPARTPYPTIQPVPKGNPLLGEKLKDLSKEDRKAAKSEDADRLARRLAKKKNRVAMEHGAGGAAPSSKRESVKIGSFGKKKGGKPEFKAKKSRVRSSAAAGKRNAKKE
ncbi:FOG: RRM domain [Phaffia rhodozyma]|uniref:Nucleolar protein 12 n=1 Tax=Phaffia rhodozyma TaxID=264483 RepID=A0A0F7SWC4_PHARH|nr:FOG: RRM domain [Phaffia rhodozyma]